MKNLLTKIEVFKLLDRFNYSIDLSDAVNIIHAPNGQGKTQFLILIDSIINQNYRKLNDIPFEKVILKFEYEEYDLEWEIKKSILHQSNSEKNDFLQSSIIHFELELLESEEVDFYNLLSFDDDIYKWDIEEDFESNIINLSFEVKVSKDFNGDLNSITTIIPELRRQSYRTWIEQETGEVLTLQEVLDSYGYYEELYNIDIEINRDEEEWLFNSEIFDLTNYIPIVFIETNRLFIANSKKNKYSNTLAISTYSNKIKKEFTKNLNSYAELSQRLDETFPQRLVKRMSNSNREIYSIGTLVQKQIDLELERNKLAELGLMEIKGTAKDNFLTNENILDESLRIVLGLNLDDTTKKLSVFKELRERIELFVKLVNEKLVDKKISLIRNKGFLIEFTSGARLGKVYQLSSGEQHIIVMLYKLLFESPSESLVLIDEPELSLHSVWQLNFLDELEYISKIRKHKYIIATHSPQIVNESWNKIQDLYSS